MKRRFIAMLIVIMTLALSAACSPGKTEEPSDGSLYPSSTATVGPVSSVWKSDTAGTLTFYEGNYVKVEFKPDFEYLLQGYGEDERSFKNNAQYHCNFFDKLNAVSMEDASSFYIWYVNGSEDFNCQFNCDVNGNTMTLSAYWPYDSSELAFAKAD